MECDQRECQYCDVNEPPCPLNTEMFEAVIAARRAVGTRRRDDTDSTMPGATHGPA